MAESIQVSISAQAPWAGDPHERLIELAAVPHRGDTVVVWHGNTEHHFEVVGTTFYDPIIGREPIVCVSTDGFHPDEVEAIFNSEERP